MMPTVVILIEIVVVATTRATPTIDNADGDDGVADDGEDYGDEDGVLYDCDGEELDGI